MKKVKRAKKGKTIDDDEVPWLDDEEEDVELKKVKRANKGKPIDDDELPWVDDKEEYVGLNDEQPYLFEMRQRHTQSMSHLNLNLVSRITL